MSVRIEQFDPKTDGDSLRVCHQMALAANACDVPGGPPISFAVFQGEWADGWGSGEPREAWLARDDAGEPVGCYLLVLQQHNLTVARGGPLVTPERRRAGAGSALLAHCAERARQAGRSRLRSYAREGSAGEAFARAKGAAAGLLDVFRTMDIDESVPARVAELRRAAQPFATDYEIVCWQIPSPDERVDDLAEIHGAMADAPRDPGIQPRAWTADRVRSLEQGTVSLGLRKYVAAALDRTTGQLVAMTETVIDPEMPDWASQFVTAVRADHRGHRLGLLVKLAMLDLLAEREPAARHISTDNAAANQHMIAINEQLGYRITTVSRSWLLDLAGS